MLGVDKYYQKRKEDKRTEIIYIVHIHVEEKKKKKNTRWVTVLPIWRGCVCY